MTSIPKQQEGTEAHGGQRFAVAIVARRNNERPSEMEIQLRSHCQKMRVVEKLNGSHLLLPKEGLAVRVYYPTDIERFDEKLGKQRPSSAAAINQMLERHHGATADDDDLDGLKEFRDKNHTTIVFCLLPRSNIDQFDKADSFINRVQRIMRTSDNTKKGRVIFAADIPSALQNLIAIADARAPRKRAHKDRYFARQRAIHYVPDESGIIPQPNGAAAAANEVLRDWANEYSLPDGEHHVLATYLGSLAAIATAGDDTLARVPIESETKALLHVFFGSRGSVHVGDNDMDTQEADIPQIVQVPQTAGPELPAMMPQGHDHASGIVPPPLHRQQTFPGVAMGFNAKDMAYVDQSEDRVHAPNPGAMTANVAGNRPQGNETFRHKTNVPMSVMAARNLDPDRPDMRQNPLYPWQPSSGKHSSAFQHPPNTGYFHRAYPQDRQQMEAPAYGNILPQQANHVAIAELVHLQNQQQGLPYQQYQHHQHYAAGSHYQPSQYYQQPQPLTQALPNTRGPAHQPYRGFQGLIQRQQQHQPQSSQQIYGEPPVPSNPNFHRGIRRFR